LKGTSSATRILLLEMDWRFAEVGSNALDKKVIPVKLTYIQTSLVKLQKKMVEMKIEGEWVMQSYIGTRAELVESLSKLKDRMETLMLDYT